MKMHGSGHTGVAVLAVALTLGAGSVVFAEDALAAAAAAPDRESDPKAVAIVDRYLEVIGGREALAAIKDRSAIFRNIKYSATGETVARIALYIKEGFKFREEWEILEFKIKDQALAFVQIYNGDLLKGWVQMFGTVSPLEGRTLSVFVYDKHLDDFFMHWKENGYTLKLVEPGGIVEDEPADVLEVIDFTGRQKVNYFFAKSSGLLVKKEWTDATLGDRVKREQFYKKYRRVGFQDGSGRSVMVPLTMEIYLDGDVDTERQYDEAKFNSNLSDKLFDKPEGKPFTSPIVSSKQVPQLQDQDDGGAAPGIRVGAGSEGEETRGPHGMGSRRTPVERVKVPVPDPAPREGDDTAPSEGEASDASAPGDAGEPDPEKKPAEASEDPEETDTTGS